MRKLIFIPFIIYILLGTSISSAQDSLKLLATMTGEDEWEQAETTREIALVFSLLGRVDGRGDRV